MEIEAKMRLHDRPAVEAQLRALGATPGPVIDELNIFLDTPEGKLLAQDRGLRVRREKHSNRAEADVIITHKGPRQAGDVKTRQEHELHCRDADEALTLLEAVGFRRTVSFEKQRTRWHVQGCQVELDRLPGLGDYIEIEGPDRDTVLDLRRQLRLENEQLITTSYASLVADYIDDHAVPGKHLAFDAHE